MTAPCVPREPTWLPSTPLGWLAVAVLGASLLPIALIASDQLPEGSREMYVTQWQIRMWLVWFVTVVVGTGISVAALVRGDRSVTALLIAMIGIPATLLVLLGMVVE